jgi:ATP-dependent helicase/nuclease subunit A
VTEKNWGEKWTQPQPLTPQKIAVAKSFADWLALWFSNQSPTSKAQNGAEGELEYLRWRMLADEDLPQNSEAQNPQSTVALPALEAAAVESLRKRLEQNYPFTAATVRKAKSSVTALRREAEELDEEAEPIFRPRRTPTRITNMGAAEIGQAHHKFLQHVALDKTGELAQEAARLARENYLTADERAALDLAALAAFWDSDLGRKVITHATDVRRELPFTTRFSPVEIATITGAKTEASLENEFVVVQGVADLAVILPQEIWLVDFKTDSVSEEDFKGKTEIYRPQLQLYAAALEKIFARKVTRRALHFLSAKRTEEI